MKDKRRGGEKKERNGRPLPHAFGGKGLAQNDSHTQSQKTAGRGETNILVAAIFCNRTRCLSHLPFFFFAVTLRASSPNMLNNRCEDHCSVSIPYDEKCEVSPYIPTGQIFPRLASFLGPPNVPTPQKVVSCAIDESIDQRQERHCTAPQDGYYLQSLVKFLCSAICFCSHLCICTHTYHDINTIPVN